MENDKKKNEIKEILIELIDPFPNNPYKVKDDDDMEHLVESVRAKNPPSYRREEYILEAMEHYARFLQRKARDYER